MRTFFLILLCMISYQACAQFSPTQTFYDAPCGSTLGISFFADIDGDEDIDMVRSCGWLRNDGSDGFSHHEAWDNSYTFSQMYPADVDGDGDLDIAALASNWFLLVNDGTGNFSIQVLPIEIGSFLGFGDVDGDGDQDLIGSRFSPTSFLNEYQWVENEGGSFEEHHWLVLEDFSYTPGHYLQIADIDKDGDVDFFLQDNNEFGLYINENGTASLTSGFVNSQAPHLADFNGDGLLDFVSWEDAAGPSLNAILRLNNGDGNLGAETIINLGPISQPGFFVAEDFSGDGFADLFVTTGFDELYYFENDQQGDLQETNLSFDALPHYGQVFPGNYHGGSGKQLLLANGANGLVSLVDFYSEEEPELLVFSPGVYLKDIEVFDYDEDGDLDVLGLFSSSGLFLFENEGDQISEPQLLLPITGFNDLLIADLKGDGEPWFWITGYAGTTAMLKGLTKNEDGNLEEQHHAVLPYPVTKPLEAHDFDADGWLDLYYHAGAPYIAFNDGSGEPSLQIAFAGALDLEIGFDSSVPVDWNGDGHMDIFVRGTELGAANEGSWVMINNGEGEFDEIVEVYFVALFEYEFIDLDGEGLPELINHVPIWGAAEIYEIGNTALYNTVIYADTPPALQDHATQVFDYELDGDLDFFSGKKLFVQESDGTHTFYEILDGTVAAQSSGDIDADGYEDLVIFAGGKFTWYRNTAASVSNENPNNEQSWQVYPNPANDILSIEPIAANIESVLIRIFNAQGRLQLQQQIFGSSNIDLTSLSEGLYLLEVDCPEAGRHRQLFTVLR